MTIKTNPFESEAEKAAIYELGYFAGFQDPSGNDSDFLPLAPELLDIYVEGVDAGREDAHAPPAADSRKQWVPRSELAEHSESSEEMKEHIGTFLVFKALEIITRKAILGLVDVVLIVIGIQGDTIPEQFKPLEDDFEGSPEDPPSDAVMYVPACSRTDHAMVTDQVSQDGTWIGAPSKTIDEALQVVIEHGHREAYVARCDVEAKTCSAVWLAKDAP
jgi:hypothetical protein